MSPVVLSSTRLLARAWPVLAVKRCYRHQCHHVRLSEVVRDRDLLPMCWSRSIVTIRHIIASQRFMNVTAYISTAQQWRVGLANPQPFWSHWLRRLVNMYGKEPRYLLPLGGASLACRAMDDTPIKMLAPGNKRTKTARVWAYVRDERPWNGTAPPGAWYQFTVDRKGEHPVRHLSNYKGWVHAPSH